MFVSCFNKNDAKTEAILEVLKDKFTVQINSGYTLLTVFNYNDAFNQLDKIIDELEPGVLRIPVLIKKLETSLANLGMENTRFSIKINGGFKI